MPSRRLAIYRRDRFSCAYKITPECKARNGELRGQEPRNIALDHVIPLAKGGTNRSTNLVMACSACNNSRQDKPLYALRGLNPHLEAEVRRRTRRKVFTQDKALKIALSMGDWTVTLRFCMQHQEK